MTWGLFYHLLPSFLLHLVMSVFFASALWWLLKKYQHHENLKLLSFVLVATVLSAWHSMGQVLELNQGGTIQQWSQAEQKKRAEAELAALPGNNPDLKLGSEDEMKVRKEFITLLDQGLAKPEQLTPQIQQQVFNSFKGIYENPQVLPVYRGNIANFMLCSRMLVSDALESMKQKKEVRSQDHQQCVTLTGEFFGREKLLDPSFVAPYEQVIASYSARKPASKDKMLTQAELEARLRNQDVALQVLGFFFPQK